MLINLKLLSLQIISRSIYNPLTYESLFLLKRKSIDQNAVRSEIFFPNQVIGACVSMVSQLRFADGSLVNYF